MLAKIPEARPGSLENLLDASLHLRYMVPPGHTLEDCLRPEYWKNNTREADQQRVFGRHAWNTIRCLAEDASWMADLLVLAVEHGQQSRVNVRLLTQWDWSKPSRSVPEGYTVEHVAGNGWRAIEPGGVMLAERQTDREAAMAAAIAHAAKSQPSRQQAPVVTSQRKP